jgi:PPOX class probable FMN-dependent enzyme
MSPAAGEDRAGREAGAADPHAIVSLDALRARYGVPHGLVLRKVLASLDAHCRRFVARSPLVMVATADAAGRCDVSPRGDAAGFVRVLGDGRLALPDRKGNDRLDALRNVLENPRVALLFVVPGSDDTLRVNGRAAITADPSLLESMAVGGRAPRTALVVTVEEAFLHCGRAFKRGRVWDPATFAARGELPTLGQMLRDQTDPDAAERRLLAESESAELY